MSGFGWNDSLNMRTVEPEVWEPLIAVITIFCEFNFVLHNYICCINIFLGLYQSKPVAKKWMTTPMPNYSKIAQLWAKNRAKGDHAETIKGEMC